MFNGRGSIQAPKTGCGCKNVGGIRKNLRVIFMSCFVPASPFINLATMQKCTQIARNKKNGCKRNETWHTVEPLYYRHPWDHIKCSD